jgi:uncharacterized membrane protein
MPADKKGVCAALFPAVVGIVFVCYAIPKQSIHHIIMPKRGHWINVRKKSTSKKTKKRLAAKHVMLEEKAKKRQAR